MGSSPSEVARIALQSAWEPAAPPCGDGFFAGLIRLLRAAAAVNHRWTQQGVHGWEGDQAALRDSSV